MILLTSIFFIYFNHFPLNYKFCFCFSSNELIKTAIEHGFRYYILTNFKKLSINDFKYLLDLSVSAAERKLCSPPTPIFLMNDILNNLTIEDCSDIFSYIWAAKCLSCII